VYAGGVAGSRKRDRTLRREDERAARRLVRERERLARLERGGAPDRPIEVPSSAVIELRARRMPCVQCGGEYQVDDHQHEAELRVVSVTCRRCHVSRRLWFRIVASGPN
jgi:hypothetical protein